MHFRFLVLLIVALLVMNLVPASVLAGIAGPSTGIIMQAGSGTERARAAPADTPVILAYDDGGYETSVGLTTMVFTNAAVWFVRFTPTASYPFNLRHIHILWPTQADAHVNLVGKTVTLLVYTDTDGDGDPGNAALVYQQPATIVHQDGVTFDTYNLTTPVALNGPGDVLIGFRDDWNLGGTAGETDSTAIDTTSSALRSWVAGNQAQGADPNINNLGNNNYVIPIDSYLPGNWLIRGASCYWPDINCSCSAGGGGGTIDVLDIQATANAWLAYQVSGTYTQTADVNCRAAGGCDGAIDIRDVQTDAGIFATSCP